MLTAEGLTIGDVVKLNSGGPDMTVIDTNPNDVIDKIDVAWFGGDGDRLTYQSFPEAALSKVPESKVSA